MNLAQYLSKLTVFALFLLLTMTLPRLMRRLRLPGPIGFIVAGIDIGSCIRAIFRICVLLTLVREQRFQLYPATEKNENRS